MQQYFIIWQLWIVVCGWYSIFRPLVRFVLFPLLLYSVKYNFMRPFFIAPFIDHYVILNNLQCSQTKQVIQIARKVVIIHSCYKRGCKRCM